MITLTKFRTVLPLLSLFAALFFLTFTTGTKDAQAQRKQSSLTIVRDTEIEDILKKWSQPVIKAAGLEPDAVNFILVDNDDLNAFVAGGPNIFLYTGLLTAAQSPGEIIGVIAHELGHIRGGHLVRTRQAAENAAYESILGTVLGIGAALATGNGGVGAAVAAGAQSTARNRFFAFSRVQESSADQAALTYLEQANMSPAGLMRFMQELESQELLPASQQSEYIRTHPLTRDRITSLQSGLDKSATKDKPFPDEWEEDYARMIAKLKGFLTPERVAWDYDSKDESLPALYARTIADYRQNRVQNALAGIEKLLALEPDNPYFLELKGQMLVDFGRLSEAEPAYRQAIAIAPEAALIRTAYAHTLIENAGENDKEKLQGAIDHLKRALRDEPRSTRNHRLLATAYGRRGQDAMARLHLAEEALLKGQTDYAQRQAEAASDKLEKNSRDWMRAQDILAYIRQKKDNDKM